MSYSSIDELQKILSEDIFSHKQDRKKAAGRALGTLIEIITYYLLDVWNLRDNVAIEMRLPEFGNKEITHNVEFTLHPEIREKSHLTYSDVSSITCCGIARNIGIREYKKNTLIDRNHIIKNATVVSSSSSSLVIANLDEIDKGQANVSVSFLHQKPFAMFECKRVGVEEGCKKGPQTIEKAKQGAYVAQMTSSLQKVWNRDGQRMGLLYRGGEPIIEPYSNLLEHIISEGNKETLEDFTLSVGIVSNHGNWFTSDNQNKELQVLSQSYDWLLFLTDNGLATFINDLLLHPRDEYRHISEAFKNSYKEGKKTNIFTKSKINYSAHKELSEYFCEHIKEIEGWFNIIAPAEKSIKDLKEQLFVLKEKNWKVILG